MAVSHWLDIDAVLSPIIGRPGVAALFERSIHLACVNHPCLASVHEGPFQPGELNSLRRALAQETSMGAARAGDALLCTFQELLANLIGAPLAERLLGNVWSGPSHGEAVRGTAP